MPLMSRVTLEKFLYLSVSQFPSLSSGNNNICIVASVSKFNEVMRVLDTE